MKKFLFLLVLLILSSQAHAGMVIGSGGEAAACSASTDYIGDKADYSAASTLLVEDTMNCVAYTATAPSGCLSGSLGYPYIAHNGVETDNVKLCIYTDSTGGTGAPNNETKIGCSTAISCNSDVATPTCTNSADVGGTVTPGEHYFLCMITDSTGFSVHRINTGATDHDYTKTVAGWYATPPDTLTAESWSDLVRNFGVYIEIK